MSAVPSDRANHRPGIRIDPSGRGVLRLHGDWTLRLLTPQIRAIRQHLRTAPPDARWVLDEVTRLDSFGAVLLWQAWRRAWPADLSLPDDLRALFEEIAASDRQPLPQQGLRTPADHLVLLGRAALHFRDHVLDFVRLFGGIVLDFLHLLRTPQDWPLREISANVFKVGVRAMPVAALVGFLIGVALSYLSALQLRAYGADVFIVNILGLGIIRELGPVLVSVLVAGRSGSAMTAQLGVMRVTEEIDALAAMGVSRSLRLVLPKVIALSIAMPLLVLWTSAMALFGGMVSASLQLGLTYGFFIETLPGVVPLANLYIALSKGFVFGLLIALIACHFGLRVKPNTESLSANTTASVVSAITIVILVDAIFAIATRTIGVPF
ncbi:MAG: ABC transporter permease [Rhodocyclaceae bacterium]|nr:ABC transporter permease [Rhodocyclaceae bacterium]